MRTAVIRTTATLTVVLALAGCDRKAGEASSTSIPARKAGMWELSLNRDGKPGRLGSLRACLDAAADSKLSVFGRHFASGDCRRKIDRDAGGVYHFSSTCTNANGATINTMGTATGDFQSGYQVHSEVNVSGAPYAPMNGMHMVDLSGRYLGACPGGVKPGDVALGSGLKVNLDQLQRLAEAVNASPP